MLGYRQYGQKGKIMTIKDFVTKKIAIAFTSPEQIKEFAKMCEGHNLKMCNGGDDAFEWMKNGKKELFDGNFFFYPNKVIHFAYHFYYEGHMGDGLCWSGNDTIDDPHYTDVGWKIVTFEEFKKNVARYRIVIESDGDVTNAVMCIDGKIIRNATAKRNPEDKFNFVTDARVAFDRMLK